MRRLAEMRDLSLLLLAVAAGCSVPPSRLGHEVNRVRAALADMESAYGNEEFDAALAKAKVVTELASAARIGILMGDPRREAVDEALARAREMRREIGQRLELKRRAERDRLVELDARAALDEAAAATDEVKGPPDGADLSAFLARAASAEERTEPVPRGLGGDVDLARHRKVAVGDKEGDVDDEDFSPVRRAAAAPRPKGPKKLVIDESTPPVVVQKLQVSGKGVAVYFTFVNKSGGSVFIGSVTGSIVRETGQRVGRLLTAFEADTFRANWDDIFSSAGKAVSAQSVNLQAMQSKQIVAVCEKPDIGTVETARIEVTTTDGKIHRGKGPQKD